MGWLIPFLCGMGAAVFSAWGVGGGTLLLLVMTLFLNVDQRTAQGINLLFFLFSAGSSILIHIQKRQIFPMVILVLAATGIVGSLGGFALAARMEEGFLRKIFGVMLVICGIFSLRGGSEKKTSG